MVFLENFRLDIYVELKLIVMQQRKLRYFGKPMTFKIKIGKS